jgi:hypothetical protein
MVHSARASAPRATTPSCTPNFLIATVPLLEFALTSPQQTRKHFLIASLSAISAPAHPGRPAPQQTHHPSLITRHCLTSFLFDTNKTRRIIILMSALMKTKEKEFSVRYKFPLGSKGNLACPERTGRVCALRRNINLPLRNSRRKQGARARLPVPLVPGFSTHQSPITNHDSVHECALLDSAGGANFPGGVGPNWLPDLPVGAK